MALSGEDLLKDWYTRLRFAQFAHYETAKTFDYMNYWLGIPVVVLSTSVGTTVFAGLGESDNSNIKIAVGLVSVFAAMLAGMQTFLKFSEKAEKHRIAAARYGAIRRQIEEILASGEPITRAIITPLRQEIDRLAEEAPHIPERIWSKRKNVLKQDQTNLVGLLNLE